LNTAEGQTDPRADFSGAGPVFASIAAALASLAFFRIWGLFSMSLAGPGEMELSGAALAREMKGPIPWVYLTPVAILSIILISAVRLVNPSLRIRWAYSIFLPLAGITLLVWPAEALAKITHHFSQLQIMGEGTMRLTWSWWVYCLSLGIVVTFGIIELASIVRNSMKNKTKEYARSR